MQKGSLVSVAATMAHFNYCFQFLYLRLNCANLHETISCSSSLMVSITLEANFFMVTLRLPVASSALFSSKRYVELLFLLPAVHTKLVFPLKFSIQNLLFCFCLQNCSADNGCLVVTRIILAG